MVTQIWQDSCLRNLALKAAQRRFDPYLRGSLPRYLCTARLIVSSVATDTEIVPNTDAHLGQKR